MNKTRNHPALHSAFERIEGRLKSKDRDRLRRALSWLGRAERTTEDETDERFLFLWIAFNAAYVPNRAQRSSSDTEFQLSLGFLRRILELDQYRLLEHLMEQHLGDSISLLVGNPYVFEPFWSGDRSWKMLFSRDNAKLQEAFRRRQVVQCFYLVLKRLHVLRNQIVHGGSTHASEYNRSQLRDGARIMARLAPAVLGIMLDHLEKHPDRGWAPVPWPRFNVRPNPLRPVPPTSADPG